MVIEKSCDNIFQSMFINRPFAISAKNQFFLLYQNFPSPSRILVLLYDDSYQKDQSGGHKMNANNILNIERIHFVSKPSASIT